MKMPNSTADKILDTAHALIADRGYAAFSYADISSEVKVSKATIHHHFPSKEILVVSVLRQHRHRLGEGIASLNDAVANPLERLKAYMSHWESCIEKRRSHSASLLCLVLSCRRCHRRSRRRSGCTSLICTAGFSKR